MAISTIGQNGLAVPLVTSADASISGLTVGKGGGSVASNTVVGNGALASNSSGTQGTAIGNQAGNNNTSGIGNIFAGSYAGLANTTGNYNSFVGGLEATGSYAVGQSNTTGSYNAAFGGGALAKNTTASNNTAVGYQASYGITTSPYNTVMGYQAGYTQSTGTGQNTYIGTQAGYLATGYNNTFVGNYSGGTMTTGVGNTIIGQFPGNGGGLDIRTASNYIVLSDGSGNPRYYINGSGQFSQSGSVNGDVLGTFTNTNASSPYGLSMVFNSAAPNNSSSFFYYGGDNTNARFVGMSNGGLKNYSGNNVNLSDRREKTNFAPAKNYLSTLCNIPVQTFNYIDQNHEEDPGTTLGVVAQDVQEVAPELVAESNWGTEEDPKMRLSIYQTDLQYAMLKAIQELNAKVTALEAQLQGK
jgi:hypothetical protein